MLFLYGLFFEKSPSIYLMMGFIAQIFGTSYLVPVLFRNWLMKQTKELNWKYVGMSWVCYFLNVIYAYCFDWPLPSKLGSAFGLFCLSSLLIQPTFYKAVPEISPVE